MIDMSPENTRNPAVSLPKVDQAQAFKMLLLAGMPFSSSYQSKTNTENLVIHFMYYIIIWLFSLRSHACGR